MPIMIDVYRNRHQDCTNNGISKRYDSLLIMNAAGPITVRDETDDHCALLEHTPHKVMRIVPCDRNGVIRPGWFMMGGNFGHTSDSRFREAVEQLYGARFYGAVAIHDRQE